MNFFKYFGLFVEAATALEAIKAAIDAGQAASTPSFNTYIDGKHVAVTVSVTPLP